MRIILLIIAICLSTNYASAIALKGVSAHVPKIKAYKKYYPEQKRYANKLADEIEDHWHANVDDQHYQAIVSIAVTKTRQIIGPRISQSSRNNGYDTTCLIASKMAIDDSQIKAIPGEYEFIFKLKQRKLSSLSKIITVPVKLAWGALKFTLGLVRMIPNPIPGI